MKAVARRRGLQVRGWNHCFLLLNRPSRVLIQAAFERPHFNDFQGIFCVAWTEV
jgi:hypothetical protein